MVRKQVMLQCQTVQGKKPFYDFDEMEFIALVAMAYATHDFQGG